MGSKFGDALCSWWTSLQPAQRRQNSATLFSRDVEGMGASDWGSLNSAGKNGILLIVLGLAWWGAQVYGGGSESCSQEVERWGLLVRDVTWVIEMLVSIGGSQGRAVKAKRGNTSAQRDGDRSSAPRSKRYVFVLVYSSILYVLTLFFRRRM